jgi:poly-gamma-glutamate synthesis protein (capsule biosynthesis protein)
MYSLPTPYQLKLYRHIIDLGAHAVIAHHTHVIGGYEYYKGCPIVYSLGNFYFPEPNNPSDWYTGLLAGITFEDNKVASMIFYKIKFNKIIELVDNFVVRGESYANFVRYVNKRDVELLWNEYIQEISNKSVKTLLNLSVLRRLLYKMGIIKIQKKDKVFLRALGNRFRCQTHKIITENAIDKFLSNY